MYLLGLVSDFAKNKYDMPRSYCLVLVSSLFCISQLVIAAVNDINHLWLVSSLLGLAYGSVYSLFPTVCIEWFGMRKSSNLYSLNPLISFHHSPLLRELGLRGFVPPRRRQHFLPHLRQEPRLTRTSPSSSFTSSGLTPTSARCHNSLCSTMSRRQEVLRRYNLSYSPGYLYSHFAKRVGWLSGS